jgi:hypothetical protein
MVSAYDVDRGYLQLVSLNYTILTLNQLSSMLLYRLPIITTYALK